MVSALIALRTGLIGFCLEIGKVKVQAQSVCIRKSHIPRDEKRGLGQLCRGCMCWAEGMELGL